MEAQFLPDPLDFALSHRPLTHHDLYGITGGEMHQGKHNERNADHHGYGLQEAVYELCKVYCQHLLG